MLHIAVHFGGFAPVILVSRNIRIFPRNFHFWDPRDFIPEILVENFRKNSF